MGWVRSTLAGGLGMIPTIPLPIQALPKLLGAAKMAEELNGQLAFGLKLRNYLGRYRNP